MPENEEEAVIDVTSPDSSISITPYIASPTLSDYSVSQGSESDSGVQINSPPKVVYKKIEIPLPLTLKDYLKKFAGSDDFAALTYVKLQVISTEICLQHLCFFTPQLTELTLDGSVIASLRDLGTALNNLKILRVSRCGLTSLDGTFGLQTLEEIYARNNSIEDLSPCSFLPNIKHIDLKKNYIKSITTVSFLNMCERLEHLELDENEQLIEIPEYRQIVKGLLPKLKTLDGKDLAGEKDFREVIRAQKKAAANCVEDAIPSTSGSNCCLQEVTTKSKKYRDGHLKRASRIEGSFTVRFPPKVLSPRPTSGSSSDSNIASYRNELPNVDQDTNALKESSDEDALTSSNDVDATKEKKTNMN